MEDLDNIENIETIQDLFSTVIVRNRFLKQFAGLNPDCGIQHRLKGTGTNKTDKRTELTPEDKTTLKDSLTKLEGVIKRVKKTL